MEWINFRHLYAFWMVCRTASFTKAAKVMQVAQSAVSDQVSQLENYLDEELLIRSTRSLQLTQAGSQLLSYAEIIFEQSKEINLYLRDKEIPLNTNLLRIGIVGGVSRNFVFRMLENYIEASPGSQVSVTTGSFEELSLLLKKFELDVVITLQLPHKRDLGECTYQKLGHSEMCLAGSKRLISSIRGRRRKKAVDVYKFRHPYEVEILERFINPKLRVETDLKLITDDIPLLRFFANSDDSLVVIPKVGILEDLEDKKIGYIALKQVPEVNVYGVFMKKVIHKVSIDRFLNPKSKVEAK